MHASCARANGNFMVIADKTNNEKDGVILKVYCSKHSLKAWTDYGGSGCMICNKNIHQDQILLCDICEGEYHMGCLDPPLEKVPEVYHPSMVHSAQNEWYCPICTSHVTVGEPLNIYDMVNHNIYPEHLKEQLQSKYQIMLYNLRNMGLRLQKNRTEETKSKTRASMDEEEEEGVEEEKTVVKPNKLVIKIKKPKFLEDTEKEVKNEEEPLQEVQKEVEESLVKTRATRAAKRRFESYSIFDDNSSNEEEDDDDDDYHYKRKKLKQKKTSVQHSDTQLNTETNKQQPKKKADNV